MRRQRCACRPRSARASTRGAGEEQPPAQIVSGARNFNLSNVTEAWPTACLCLHIGTFGSCGGVGEQGFENFGGGQPLGAGASESTEKRRRTTVRLCSACARGPRSAATTDLTHSPP